jgi:quinol monooxygenase YgiN
VSRILVVDISPKEGMFTAVGDVFRAIIPRVHAENGCELYALHQTNDGYILIEKWADAEALTVHGKGQALKDLKAALDGLLSRAMDIRRAAPVPVGDTRLGAL